MTVFTALAGLADRLRIERGTELWKTATSHLVALLTATVFFGLAALLGHSSWKAGNVSSGEFALTLIGFGVMALGGAIVFANAMRVPKLVEAPAGRAVASVPHRRRRLQRAPESPPPKLLR